VTLTLMDGKLDVSKVGPGSLFWGGDRGGV
jgi:hypothetical protein